MKKIIRNRYFKSALAIIVIIFLILSSVMYSFGATKFKDVKTDHWATTYIDRMVEKNIVKGYEDSTFKPDSSVSRIEAIVMITRLFNSNDIDSTYASSKSKYESELKKYNVPTWAYPQLVFALDKGIMNKVLIPELVKNNKNQEALRVEIAIAITKALGLTGEMDKNAKLTFVDANQIPKDAVPYIDILIKKGIINSKGDWQGKFNPTTPITRSEMSKMLSSSYDLKYGNNSSNNNNNSSNNNSSNNNNSNTDNTLVTVDGEIYDVNVGSEYLTLIVLNSKDQKLTYTNKIKDVSIKWGSDSINASSLKDDMKVSITAKGSTLMSVKVLDSDIEREGYYQSAYMSANGIQTVKFKVDSKYEEYQIQSSTRVIINGKESSIYNAKSDDKAEFTASNGKLSRVEITSKERTVEGIVKKISSSKVTATIDKKEYDFEMDKSTKLYRDDEKCELSDIRVGDEIKLYLEYDKVIKLYSEGVSKKVYGTLKEIKVAQVPEIVVLLEDEDELETYKLKSGFVVERDKDTIGLFDLKINSRLKITLESDRVSKIEDLSSSGSDKVSGKIISRDKSNSMFELKEDGTGNTIYVKYTSKTTVIDEDGNTGKKADRLDKDDVIIVIGDNKIGTIEARTIMVLTK